MNTLYKKGNQYHKKYGDVYYDFDIISVSDDDMDNALKSGWVKSLPETVSKRKAKAVK